MLLNNWYHDNFFIFTFKIPQTSFVRWNLFNLKFTTYILIFCRTIFKDSSEFQRGMQNPNVKRGDGHLHDADPLVLGTPIQLHTPRSARSHYHVSNVRSDRVREGLSPLQDGQVRLRYLHGCIFWCCLHQHGHGTLPFGNVTLVIAHESPFIQDVHPWLLN